MFIELKNDQLQCLRPLYLGKKCIAKKGGYKGGRGWGLEVLPPKAVNLDIFLGGSPKAQYH